jgi:putative transferase (TIGR04331 family)
LKTKDNPPAKYLLLCDVLDVDLGQLKGEVHVPFLYESMDSQNISDLGISYVEENDGDPEQFVIQYKYLGKLYDLILSMLVESLNTFQKKTWTKRQWELVLGPWLRVYLESLYHRWVRLDSLLAIGVSQVYISETCRGVDGSFIAANRDEFVRKKILNEHWNHCVLSRMAVFKFSDRKGVTLKTIRKDFTIGTKEEKTGVKKFSYFDLKRSAKIFIQRLVETISYGLSTKNSIVINSPYLSLVNKLRLAFSLKKMPVFYFNRDSESYRRVATESRKFQINDYEGYEGHDDFYNFVCANVCKEVPSCYVENLHELEREVDDLDLPADPEIIYTGSGVESDELIRIFIARQVVKGTKYIISQHGGVYGTRLIPTKSEFYEHRVADRWISWGWTDPDNEKVKPGVNLKEIDRKPHDFSKGAKILFALPNVTYVPSRLMPLQPVMRVNENQKIVQGFNDDVLRDLVIRAHPNHRQKTYVKSIANGCDISAQPDFWNDLIDCKLFITTNNSTTFLQAIIADCPSVLILLGRQKVVRRLSMESFSLLEKVGIVFTDAQLATNHINMISKNPEGWWRSETVQRARTAFCLQHTHKSANAINHLSKIFK